MSKLLKIADVKGDWKVLSEILHGYEMSGSPIMQAIEELEQALSEAVSHTKDTYSNPANDREIRIASAFLDMLKRIQRFIGQQAEQIKQREEKLSKEYFKDDDVVEIDPNTGGPIQPTPPDEIRELKL